MKGVIMRVKPVEERGITDHVTLSPTYGLESVDVTYIHYADYLTTVYEENIKNKIEFRIKETRQQRTNISEE